MFSPAGRQPMIADFRYDSSPGDDVISVELLPSDGGSRAVVRVPAAVLKLLEAQVPKPAEIMTLDSALGYGVFLAAKSHRALVICGDRDLWPAEWGHLRDRAMFH